MCHFAKYWQISFHRGCTVLPRGTQCCHLGWGRARLSLLTNKTVPWFPWALHSAGFCSYRGCSPWGCGNTERGSLRRPHLDPESLWPSGQKHLSAPYLPPGFSILTSDLEVLYTCWLFGTSRYSCILSSGFSYRRRIYGPSLTEIVLKCTLKKITFN